MPKRKSPKKRVSKTTTEPRAAIYIRVSTQYQTDRASLPVQCEELINYAKYALSINSYEIFEDAGFSAKNTDRPAYQQMIARVRNGEFTHVLVWKIDRISRNLLDFTAMYQELKNLGVTFISKNEQFDTSTAIGEAMLRIILVFAELERKMTSERVSAVMVSRASKGDWNGGKIPYGYDYDKDTGEFSINEDEAKVINLIYDLYESEKSLTVVAKYLNDHGYRARSGKPWNPTTTRKMLVSPFYAGVRSEEHTSELQSLLRRRLPLQLPMRGGRRQPYSLLRPGRGRVGRHRRPPPGHCGQGKAEADRGHPSGQPAVTIQRHHQLQQEGRSYLRWPSPLRDMRERHDGLHRSGT